MSNKSQRSPRTRTETQQAAAQVRAQQNAIPAVGLQALTEQRQRAATAMEAVGAVQLDKTQQRLTLVGLDMSKTVMQMQQQLTEQFGEFQTVRDATVAYRAELEELYGKDVIQNNLADLIAEHDAKAAALAQKFTDAQAEHSRNIAELNRTYEARRQELERARQQETADYTFRTSEARREEERRYNEQRRELEREYGVRLAALETREKELEALRKQVEGFDALIKSEVDKTVAIATNSLKKDLTNQHALDRKDLESRLALAQADNHNMAKQLAATEARAVELQKQLSTATDRIKEISIAAMESSSNQRALDAVNQFAQREGQQAPARNR